MSVEDLATWVSAPGAVAPEVRRHALAIIEDSLGVALAATAEPEVRAAGSSADRIGGAGRSTILATGMSSSAYAASLVNGQAAISLELDEGSQWATNHPSAHVLPAALAVAQDIGATGAQFLDAFCIGYETAARTGRAMRVREAVHPFGTAMVVGAAASVANLLGLNRDRTFEVFQVAAALTPASTQRAANQGATVRNLITGVCAAAGVQAAWAVAAGVGGDRLALETVYGEVLGSSFDASGLADGLGEDWLMTRNYFKVHACSRWNHAPIEATAGLLRETPVDPDEIAEITVFTYAPATRLNSTAPVNAFAGKHSIPFNVAARIVLGNNGVEAYRTEVVRDPVMVELMGRVRVVEDPEMTAAAPDVRAARVEIRTHDGRTLMGEEAHPPGGFDNPYTQDVLDQKFDALVARGGRGGSITDLREWVRSIPELTDLGGLGAILRSDDQDDG